MSRQSLPKRRAAHQPREEEEEEEAEAEAGAGRWAHLPLDAFSFVVGKSSISHGDHVRFSAACRPYALLSASLSSQLLPPRWDAPTPAHLYPKLGQLRPLVPLRSPSPSPPPPIRLHAPKCVLASSSRGLLLLADHHFRFSLFDPRAGTVAHLLQPHAYPKRDPPVLEDIFNNSIGRLHLLDCAVPESLSLTSSDPADCVALSYWISAPRLLMYWRSGDDHWTDLPCPESLHRPCHVYHRGRFYIVDDEYSEAFILDATAEAAPLEVRHIPVSQRSIESVRKVAVGRRSIPRHLVECGGDLLVVVGGDLEPDRSFRYPSNLEASTFWCHVFKLDMGGGEGEAEWLEVRDIGRHALFLGLNEAFSISTRDVPRFEPNCV